MYSVKYNGKVPTVLPLGLITLSAPLLLGASPSQQRGPTAVSTCAFPCRVVTLAHALLRFGALPDFEPYVPGATLCTSPETLEVAHLGTQCHIAPWTTITVELRRG